MPLLAFAVMVAYWPGAAGAATTPRWALLACVAPWLLRDARLTAAHAAGLGLLAWAAVSMLWSPSGLDAFRALAGYLILAVCFCLGYQLDNLRGVLTGAAWGLAVSSLFAIGQSLGWHPFETINPVAGLFVNGNFLAEPAALVLVGAVTERMWWTLPLVLPSILLPDGRGAIVAALAALAVHYRRAWRLTAVAVGLMGGLLIVSTAYVMIRHGSGLLLSLDHLANNVGVKGAGPIAERLQIWASSLHGMTVFGWGLGSFWSVYPHFDLRVVATANPEHAHSEFLTIAFELGLPGLVAFLVFCATLMGPLDTPRLMLIALLVESLFEFPLHLPATAFLGMVAAGFGVRSRYLLGDLAYRRRGAGELWRETARVRRFYGLAHSRRADHAVRSSLPGVPGYARNPGKAT